MNGYAAIDNHHATQLDYAERLSNIGSINFDLLVHEGVCFLHNPESEDVRLDAADIIYEAIDEELAVLLLKLASAYHQGNDEKRAYARGMLLAKLDKILDSALTTKTKEINK